MRLRNRDLELAIIAFVLMLAYFASVSCISLQRSGPEPDWTPSIYEIKSSGSECVLARDKERISCTEPRAFDFVCVDSAEMVSLKSKLQRCEVWR